MGLVKYEKFRASDFVEFFNLEEIGNVKNELLDKGSCTVFHFKPGSFKEHIEISVQLDDLTGEITRGDLYLAREWIGNEMHVNMLSTDITKSFLTALVHENDGADVEMYTNAIWHAHGTKDIVVQLAEKEAQAAPPPLAVAMVEVYEGLKLSIDVKFSRSRVSLENEFRDGRDTLHVYITTTDN